MNKKREDLPVKIKWLQNFFSVAGMIAPVTAIQILVKLVFSPRKRKLRMPHLEVLKKARKFFVEVEEFRNPKKKLKLSFYSWGKGPKTVLLVHGWDAMALDFYKLIPALVEGGYHVIAFDGPAHGDSEGDRTNMIDFKEILLKILPDIGVPYAIIGHSMGGASAAFMLMEYNIKIKRLVMMASPIVARRYFEDVFALMKVPQKMQQLFYKGMDERLGEPIEKYSLLLRKDKIKADKVMVVYDDRDEVISAPDIEKFLSLRPEVKGVAVRGAGHNKIIRHRLAIQAILEFLE